VAAAIIMMQKSSYAIYVFAHVETAKLLCVEQYSEAVLQLNWYFCDIDIW